MTALKAEIPDATVPLPMDLVTPSGSGTDPDINPSAAIYRARRIAKARHLSVDKILALIAQHTMGRTIGVLGEPRVNVMELNRALDGV